MLSTFVDSGCGGGREMVFQGTLHNCASPSKAAPQEDNEHCNTEEDKLQLEALFGHTESALLTLFVLLL